MKKIRKMDERELNLSFHKYRICYMIFKMLIVIYFFLNIFGVIKGMEGIYLSIIIVIDAITNLITSVRYN